MARILLLGSDKSETTGVDSLLREDGHAVYVLRAVERWREAEAARQLDLIVAALRPSERLFTALAESRKTRCVPVPILIVQRGSNLPQPPHLEERLVDRIAIPFAAEDFLARVDALVRVGRAVCRMRAGSPGNGDAAAPRVDSEGLFWRLGIQFSALLGTRIPRYARPRAPYAGVAARVAGWADRRDAFLPGHAERVAAFAALIAGRIELPDAETATTVRAALLHDIGKVALPIELLRQHGALAEDQRRLIQTHPERGAAILDALNTDDSIVEAIRYHHERIDGTGGHRKSRRDLPWAPRVLAVADTYDAMTSSRAMPALSQDSALQRIRELRGEQLDPDCVDALFCALKPRPQRIGAVQPRS